MTIEAGTIHVARIADADCADDVDFLIDDGWWLGDGSALRGMVLPAQDESRARGLLEMEVPMVFLGEAALTDAELVERLAARYGAGRIGVYLPVKRVEVSWHLETESNADFRTFTPSHCEPAWEMLRADGSRTGTHAAWWLEAMFERGASSAMIRADILDDADLNLCAGLTERYGDRLWFTPASPGINRYADWRRWGKVVHLAVAPADFEADAEIQSLRGMSCREPLVA
jgi:hypothetical protein